MKKALLAFLFSASAFAQVQIGKGVQIGGGGTGTGTVTGVSVTTANGFQGTVASPSTTPAIQINVDGTHVLPVNTGSASNYLGQDGAYHAASTGGGLTGQTTNCAPKANSATTSTGPMPICDDGTTTTLTHPTVFDDGSGKAGFTGIVQGTAQSILANTIGITGPSSITGYNFELPGAAPSGSNTYLSCSNASPSICSWAAGGGGGGTPGGSNGQIQYNNSGAFGGSAATITAAGAVSIPANVTPPSTATKLTLGTDATAAHLEINPNAAGTAYLVSIVSAGTSTHCAELGTDGLSIIDSGATCSGITSFIKYVSQLPGIHANTDLTAGGGGDNTATLNTVLATATATNPVVLYFDAPVRVSGNGLQGPAAGNWALLGNGGGIQSTQITNCGITSNVATFVTQSNVLAIGQHVQMSGLTHCPLLDGVVLTVNSSGLTSTGFTANFTTSNVSSGAETGEADTYVGVGIFATAGMTASVVSNGIIPGVAPYTGTDCESVGTAAPARGSNLIFDGMLININGPNQTKYCHGIQIANAAHGTVRNVVFVNSGHYSVEVDNGQDWVFDSNTFFHSAGETVSFTDGIHIEGPSSHIAMSKNYFANLGDDSIALNANEGHGGPIDDVTISDTRLNKTYDFLRLDSEAVSGSPGPNGYSTVTNVVAKGTVGSTLSSPILIGNGACTLANCVDKILMTDWSITNLNTNTSSGQQGELIDEASPVGTIKIAHGIVDSPAQGKGLINDNSTGSFFPVDATVEDVTVKLTPTGHSMSGIFSSNASAKVGTLHINGFNVESIGGSYSIPCVACNGAGTLFATSVLGADTIDPANITSIYNSGDLGSNLSSFDGSGIFPKSGTAWCINAAGTSATCGPNFPNPGIAFTSTDSSTAHYINTSGPGGQPLVIGQGFTPGGASGGSFIQFNANTFGNGSQNQLYLGSQGGINVVLDGNFSGHNPGNFGIGYGYAAIVPYPLSVTGASGFACTGTTCALDIDATGKVTSPLTVTSSVAGDFGITVNNSDVGSGSDSYLRVVTNNNLSTAMGLYALPSGRTPSGIIQPLSIYLGAANGMTNGMAFNTETTAPIVFAANNVGGMAIDSSGKATMPSGEVMGWASGTILPTSHTPDTGLSRDSAGVVDVGNGTAGNTSGTVKAATGTFGTALTVAGNNVCQSTGTNCPSSTAHGQYYWSFPSVASDGSGFPVSSVYYLPNGLSSVAALAVARFSGTCTSYPVMTILDLGTSAGSTSGTTLLTITTTASGVFTTSGTVSVSSGHYLGISTTDTIACTVQNDLDVTMTY